MYRSLKRLRPEPPLPFGYRVDPWCDPMLPAYAAVLAVAFADSREVELYPRLASREGCIDLLRELTELGGFSRGMSLLVMFSKEPCALVMASRQPGSALGRIDTVAIAPRHRRMGLGTFLVNKTLWAFHDRQLPYATIHVNRSNRRAIRFLRSLHFQLNVSGMSR